MSMLFILLVVLVITVAFNLEIVWSLIIGLFTLIFSLFWIGLFFAVIAAICFFIVAMIG